MDSHLIPITKCISFPFYGRSDDITGPQRKVRRKNRICCIARDFIKSRKRSGLCGVLLLKFIIICWNDVHLLLKIEFYQLVGSASKCRKLILTNSFQWNRYVMNFRYIFVKKTCSHLHKKYNRLHRKWSTLL